MRHTTLLALLVLAACTNSGFGDVILPVPELPTVPATGDVEAVGITLDAVRAYQGVEITLYDSAGDTSELQAPLINNRTALVRVFVDPDADFESRKIKAVLEVESSGEPTVLTQRMKVSDKSKIQDLESTINFEVPPELITADTKFHLDLYEAETETTWTGESHKTSWNSGLLDVQRTDVVTVRILPVAYNADGSGRLPDTSQTQLDRYHDLLYSMYPAEEIVIEVGDTIQWNRAIRADGSGWDELLDAVTALRDQANVDSNTYFYAAFEPEASFSNFCNFGCVLGLSWVAWTPNDPSLRASIGIGYTGDWASETMAHEVGHAHGREHAPCGTSPSDPQYPYQGAKIGSWGYDLITGELFSPDTYVDIMSYCSPTWISDYNYYALYQRIQQVGNQARASRIPWQAIRVDMHGNASFDTLRNHEPVPSPERVTVQLTDAGGSVTEVEGYFLRYSDLHGGRVLIPPDDAANYVSVRVPELEL